MSDSESIVTETELARTYDGGDYDDAWDAVEQYRRAITYERDNPDAGIGEIVRTSGATRVSVQSWIDDGGTPAVVQGLYTAHSYRWLGVTYDELTPLNILVANVFCGGTLSDHNYHPVFTVDSPDESMVANTLELMGCGSTVVTDADDVSGAAIRPAKDAAVLGRVLSVLGAPVGSKTTHDNLSLPSYLEDAPTSVRKRFVEIYLDKRSQPQHDSAGLRISENRPDSYRKELADLIESVAGEQVSVTDSIVLVSADAARALGFERRADTA